MTWSGEHVVVLCFSYVDEMWVDVGVVAVMRCLTIVVRLEIGHVLRNVLGLGANVIVVRRLEREVETLWDRDCPFGAAFVVYYHDWSWMAG